METRSLVAFGILGAGGFYLLSRSGALGDLALPDFGLGPGAVDTPGGPLSPAQLAQLQARTAGAGNTPIVASTPFVGSPQGIGAIATVGASVLPLLGVGGVALGITTAGIGLAVAFVTYELLKQRASMHTNDVRDQWERQFVDLHRALGIRPLTADQVRGSAPGTVEMAEVIFNFDHDRSQRLWHAVQGTQDERVFRAAAANVDRFLASVGVPVQDVA